MDTTLADDFLSLQRWSDLPTLMGRCDRRKKMPYCEHSANQAIHQLGWKRYDLDTPRNKDSQISSTS